jgi:23S rRNA (uracil1939-C5)-methyltransferase
VEQARENASLNAIANVRFEVAAVEDWLPLQSEIPDIVFLDPPRKGCDRAVLEALVRLQPSRIVYLSCKPATLARDLKILCQSGRYRLNHLQPADFFPQTAHVESVAFLESIHP